MNLDEILICSTDNGNLENVPTEIKILPLGHVISEKGQFTVDKESLDLMKQHMLKRNLDIVVDYEHQTLNDTQAPAGGWIKELYMGDDAIMAKVEWTQKAKDYLANKEYRYLSPVIYARKGDKKAIQLHSVALTNTPAIDGMFPIINKTGANEGTKGEQNMDLKKMLLAILGMPEDTEDEALIEAFKAKCAPAEVVANKVVLDLLKLKEDAKTEEVCAAIVKNQADNSELLALKARLDKNDADLLINKALSEGKLSAAQKSWAEAYALKDKDGFSKYLDIAPVVVPMGSMNINDSKKSKVETDPLILKQLGVSNEDVEKYGGKE